MAKYKITLTDQERAALGDIISHRSSKSAQVKRSYLLLAADKNGDKHWTDEQISSAYGVSVATVERLPPAGYQQWTLRLLADQMVVLEYVEHISHESVRQLLKKTR